MFFVMAPFAIAGEVEIKRVELKGNLTTGDWKFDVTLKHADTGWKHYADAWRVVDEQGKELGKRVLYHPHVHEQPFTRSLSGVKLKEDSIIYLEAHDLEHGWSKDRVKIDLTIPEGDRYRVRTYRR